MNTSTGRNVPSTLPMVEMPKMRPAEAPTWPCRDSSRTRNGLVMPITTIGGAKSTRMPSSEPTNTNENDESSPVSAPASPRNSGTPKNGIARSQAQAPSSSLSRGARSPFRSASRPPTM
jgi:hypothetical protein